MKAFTQGFLLILGIAALSLLIDQVYPWQNEYCDENALGDEEVCVSQLDLDQDILWVDARSEAQWNLDGVRGSFHLEQSSLNDESKLEPLLERLISAEQILIYCGGGSCEESKAVRQYLLDLELNTNVKVILGGYPALRKELQELF